MFCPNCGGELREGSMFCPACGERVGEEDAPQGAEPSVEDAPAQEPSPSDADSKGRPVGKVVAIAAGVAVAVAVGVAAFVAAGGIRQLPELPEEEILGNFGEDTAANIAIDSEWGSSEPFSLVSSEVTSSEDSVQEETHRVVYATVVYENPSYRATSEWTLDYKLQGEKWEQVDCLETSRTLAPSGPIPDEKLVEHVPTFMEMADEEPYKDAEGDSLYLTDLYRSGTSFAVVENGTGEGGGSAVISISGMDGIKSYSGTLSVEFGWDESAEDWYVESCSADEASYQASLDGLVGTWRGFFSETGHNSVMGSAACYGGRANPPVLTVKSVDSAAGTATVDLSYLVHRHVALDNAADSSSGDEYDTVTDALITFAPDRVGTYYQIYEGDGCEISLRSDEGGKLWLKVYTTASFSDSGSRAWREDIFELVKE